MKIIIIILLFVPLCIQAAILNVALDGTQPYTSIQTAINASIDQDTILVHPGRYYENIEISGRQLTVGSLELITGDSTYIAQTIVDGNQSGSCFNIYENFKVTIQGFYLTNGIGTIGTNWRNRNGGAIYAFHSDISVINCVIIGNKSYSGAGIMLYYSSGYLAGTTITNNWGKYSGALAFSSLQENTILFDQNNRCSIYCNYATYSNDILIASGYLHHIDIYLDKCTVSDTSSYVIECIRTTPSGYEQEFTYTLYYNTAVMTQQFADYYVSPEGDDNNSGLSIYNPIKTIAVALMKIGADSEHPHTIHLANGVYGEEQHFPLNLRSYVSIVGESENGVVFTGPDVFFIGLSSEKEATIRNITFEAVTDQEFYLHNLIECVSYVIVNGVLDKFSLTLENLCFRNCQPVHYDNIYILGEFAYPERLILRNITVKDCMGTIAIHAWGGNIYADNINIHHFYAPPYGEQGGRALSITTNNPGYTGGDNIFNNILITGCIANSVDGGLNSIVNIKSSFLPTTFKNYFINTTITGNYWATGYGAAITLGEDGKAIFINSIINNSLGIGMNFFLRSSDLPSRLSFLNCLVGPAENPWDTVFSESPNNIVEWYGNNLSSDPDFYAYNPNNPYTLGQNSPCIDAGTTDFSIFDIPDWYQFPLYDLAGNPRIYGNQVDLGAYEWQGEIAVEDLVAVSNLTISSYPNPFNSSTTISYNLPGSGEVRINIYNTKGQLVKTLIAEDKTKGSYQIIWDGKDKNGNPVSSSLYLLQITAGKQSRVHKMILLK